MAKDTGKKLADMMYARQPFDVPTPENLRLGREMIEKELREKAARDAKLTTKDRALSALEAAKMLGTAAVAGIGSIPTRIVKGPEAAEKYMQDRIFIPTTEKGLEHVEDIGNFLEQLETKYKLPPILPEAMALQHLTGPATQQAKRVAAKAAEKGAKNLAAPRTLHPEAGVVGIGKTAPKPAKENELALPPVLPRAPAKTKEEIRPYAQRMAQQMTGEFYRPNPKKSENVAGKSFSQFKMEKDLEHDIRPTREVVEPEVADIEKQLGMLKIGISGDTTIADKILHRAGPYELFDPSPQHGGPRYGLGGEGAWASNNPIAANVQKRVNELSEAYGAPPLGQYMAMGPQGSNFAQHFADANLQAIDISAMTKSQIEQINKLIREGSDKSGPRPSFPGIEDKGSAYLHFAIDPELRKHFNDLMQKTSVTEKLNLPDGRIILHAITEPELRDKEILNTGFSQMRLKSAFDPESLQISAHPTYSHVIPHEEGSTLTRTKYPVPGELEFSDVLNYAKQHYRPQDMTRVFQTATPRQIVDPQHIDEMKMYEELMKEYTGKRAGGSVHISDNPDTMQLELAGGGLVKGLVKAAKGMQDVLPAAEREANLAKFREQSKAPMRLYHGTTASEGGKGQEAIRRIKPSKEGALGSGVYMTPKADFAGSYAEELGGNVLPVHAQIRNPLLIEGKGDPMIEALVKLGMDEESASKMVEKAYEQKGYIGKQVENRARAAGYDGLMQYRDGDLTEVVSYNPNAVKSAIGNQGTYNVFDPDLNKAAGGEVQGLSHEDMLYLQSQEDLGKLPAAAQREYITNMGGQELRQRMASKYAGGGEITADDLILEERKL